MESSEHKLAYISPPICSKQFVPIFWIQNSTFFPDLFSKTISFSRLKVFKKVTNGGLDPGTKFFHDNGRLCTNPAIVFNVVCNLLLRRHVTCILVSDGPLNTATSQILQPDALLTGLFGWLSNCNPTTVVLTSIICLLES